MEEIEGQLQELKKHDLKVMQLNEAISKKKQRL